MATATQEQKALNKELIPEQRVVLRNVGWDGYEALLRMVGDGHVRLTYDRGDVELKSPSLHHEDYKILFGRLIEMLTVELDIPCNGAGSTTFRNPLEERGLEPDECYYLANVERILGKKELDLNVDPPPDLAIEIEISRSAMDRMGIYAALGVPEVWRFDGKTLTVELLRSDRTYVSASSSDCLPYLSPEEFVHWIQEAKGRIQTTWIRNFRDWVRAVVVPRLANE